MPKHIALSIDNQIAMVKLNRADKHNALNLSMFLDILAIQKKISKLRKQIRAVIIFGDGDDFCSGLDIKSLLGNRLAALQLLWKWLPWHANKAQQCTMGWRNLPVPVIAAIQGRCWGGGMQIALGADFRIAAPNASLSIMETKWGLIPDMGGSITLRTILGCDQAMRLTMTAQEINATEALQLGLITAINEPPLTSAVALAKEICAKSPDAITATKRLYQKGWQGITTGALLALETAYQMRILTNQNQRIAVQRQRGKKVDFKTARCW